MRDQQTLNAWLQIFRDVILVDFIIFSFNVFIYLLAGWETLHQFGNGLVWTGVIGMILLMLSAGWRDARRQDLVALSQVMREDDAFYLLNRENSGRARFMLVGLIALMISFAVGLILLRIT